MTTERAEAYAISEAYTGRRVQKASRVVEKGKPVMGRECDNCKHRVRHVDITSLWLCDKATHPFNRPEHPFSNPAHPQHDPSAKRAASVALVLCKGRHWELRR